MSPSFDFDRHPLDGNTIAADRHYDDPAPGINPGDECARVLQAWAPDEDDPGGVDRCTGTIRRVGMTDQDPGWHQCDACGWEEE